MKVFHIFVICVRKREQKCSPISDPKENLLPLSNCAFENILEYHKMMTTDLDDNFGDEYWKSKFNSHVAWYTNHCSKFRFYN